MKTTNLIKALLLALSITMMLSLVACVSDPETEDQSSETESSVAESNSSTEKNDHEESDKADTESDSTPATESSDEETTETESESETDAKVPCETHTPGSWSYATDEDSSTKLAILSATCTKCGETVTKDATFYTSIESVFGNDSTNPTNVTLFQAGADLPPMMGSEMVTLGAGKENCPADGIHPIAYDSTTGFAGLFGVGGWAGYLGSSTSDGAAFMAVDETGNVILDWTPVTGILESAGLPLVSEGGEEINATLGNVYTDGTAGGIRFFHIIDARQYSLLAGKKVDIILAFVTNQGVAEDVYIPYLVIEDMQIPEAQ